MAASAPAAVETMIVMEALGKALVLEPYLATVVLGGGFLRHGGSAEQKAAHIPGIIDGSKTFAFAQLEKNSRYDLADVSTSAKKKGDGWVIDGEKFVVLNGETADMLVVTARTKGGQRDKSGIGVFLVPGNAKGVAKKGYPTQDGLHAADITLHRRRGRRRCRDRRSRKWPAADRARGRRSPHRAVRRSGRRDG